MSYKNEQQKIDKLHEKCSKCELGSYEHSDDDHLCCDMCAHEVERWENTNEVFENFQKFMQGVEKKENKNKQKRFLNEESPARKYVKRYTELPQNRILIKGK